MNKKINASAAVAFLLQNEYQRFSGAWDKLNEKNKKEDQKKKPTFDEWLIAIKVVEEESKIIKPNGIFGK